MLQFSTNTAWQGKFKVKEFDGRPLPVHPDTGERFNPSIGWINASASIETLLDYVRYGFPISAQLFSSEGAEGVVNVIDDRVVNNTVYGYRHRQNFWRTNVALVDIDEGMSIEESTTSSFFEMYGTAWYASPSYTTENQKHRLIFALDKLIEDEEEMCLLLTSLIRIFEGDAACKDGARLFFGAVDTLTGIHGKSIPANVVDQLIADEREHTKRVQTDDSYTDYVASDDEKQYVVEKLKDHYLGNYNDWFRVACGLQSGGYAVEDFIAATVGGMMSEKTEAHCRSLWRDIERGRTTGRKATMGSVWGLIGGKRAYYDSKPPEEDTSQSIEEFVRVRKKHEDVRVELADDLLIWDKEPDTVQPMTRSERLELIRKKCVGKKFDIMLSYAREGFGKSYAAQLQAETTPVLFACLSNEQAAEQAQSFHERGLQVQAIFGTEYTLRHLYGVEAVMFDGTNPWDSGTVNKSATIRLIEEDLAVSRERAEEIFDECTPERPDFDNHQIVVTTIARVKAWGNIQARLIRYGGRGLFIPESNRWIPKNAVIYFDDAPANEFMYLYPFTERFEDAKIDGRPIEVKEIEGRRYFVRPESRAIGYGLIGNRLVITTTEMLTCLLVEAMYGEHRIYKPKLMPDKPIDFGDVTMIKTKLTGAKFDAILPAMSLRIGQKYPHTYIANGQGMRWNLENTKGQNQFTDHNTVIEISVPHRDKVTHLIDEMNLTQSHRALVELVIALDELHQALGRNSGYRWSDAEVQTRPSAVVLAAPRLYRRLGATLAYNVTCTRDNPENDVWLKMERNDMIDEWSYLLTYWEKYVKGRLFGGRCEFENDVEAVIETLPRWNAIRYKTRLQSLCKQLESMGHNVKRIRGLTL